MVSSNEHREFLLKQFLRGFDSKGKSIEGGPKTLGQIFQYLVTTNYGYNQKKGLVNKLRTLEKKGEIEKIKREPYPVYAIKKDSLLDFAIAGEQFCEHTIIPAMGPLIGLDENYWGEKRSITSLERIDPYDKFEEKLVKNLVIRYGFYLLSALVKNLEYWLLKTNGNIKHVQSRKIWLSHALDFSKYQSMIFRQFLDMLTEDTVDEDKLDLNKKKVAQRIKKVKKTMEEFFPKLYQTIDTYEHYYERQEGVINKLKKNKDFMDDIKI